MSGSLPVTSRMCPLALLRICLVEQVLLAGNWIDRGVFSWLALAIWTFDGSLLRLR